MDKGSSAEKVTRMRRGARRWSMWLSVAADGALAIEDTLSLDPGHPAAAQHLVDVGLDLVRNYRVDGIHFDRTHGSSQKLIGHNDDRGLVLLGQVEGPHHFMEGIPGIGGSEEAIGPRGHHSTRSPARSAAATRQERRMGLSEKHAFAASTRKGLARTRGDALIAASAPRRPWTLRGWAGRCLPCGHRAGSARAHRAL